MPGARPCFSEGRVFGSFGLPPGQQVDLARGLRVGHGLLQLRRGGGLDGPRPLERGRSHPPVEDAQEVPAARVPDEEHPRVEDALEPRVLHGPPGGLAVDVDEDGRRRREEDPRGSVGELERPDRLVGLGDLQHRRQAVEGQRLGQRGGRLAQGLENGALQARPGREGHPADLGAEEGHQPSVPVDDRGTVHPDDPEDRGGLGLLLHREGGVHGQPVPVPRLELGLVDGHRARGRLVVAGPAPVDGSRGARRRGGGERREGRDEHREMSAGQGRAGHGRVSFPAGRIS